MNANTTSLYTLENPVFANYSFYAALVGLKMLLMAFLTVIQRLRKRVSFIPFYTMMSDNKYFCSIRLLQILKMQECNGRRKLKLTRM